MSRRPPSTYLTADELKEIAQIKLNEAVPAQDRQQTIKSQEFDDIERHLASKEMEPPNETVGRRCAPPPPFSRTDVRSG